MASQTPDSVELLISIDKKLGALLAIAIADRLPDTSRARGRSLDTVLDAIGLSQAEIATLTGKSRQAVSQALAADAAGRQTGQGKRKASALELTDD